MKMKKMICFLLSILLIFALFHFIYLYLNRKSEK